MRLSRSGASVPLMTGGKCGWGSGRSGDLTQRDCDCDVSASHMTVGTVEVGGAVGVWVERSAAAVVHQWPS